MDIFEKLNKAFAGWYESWFGDTVSDLRPKDILRKIVAAMEDNRKEGLDNKVYVPNKYILEMAFDSDEEREYLLAFLDKEELESALRKYMSQNRYYVRGQLDFTIEEISREDGGAQPQKVTVKCRWDVQRPPKETEPAPASFGVRIPEGPCEEEELTVAGTDVYDASTVAPPRLEVTHVDGSNEQFPVSKMTVVVGRSRRVDNDLVIDKDGMVSKRHAQISLAPAGYTIVDLDSTNGVWVNGKRVENCVLCDGDKIRLGATEMVFRQSGAQPTDLSSGSTTLGSSRPRLVMGTSGVPRDEFLLASEVVIGRLLTSDVRLDDPTVAGRHARVFSHDGTVFHIEDLGSQTGTEVNDSPVVPGSPVRLRPGDQIRIGNVSLRFECD